MDLLQDSGHSPIVQGHNRHLVPRIDWSWDLCTTLHMMYVIRYDVAVHRYYRRISGEKVTFRSPAQDIILTCSIVEGTQEPPGKFNMRGFMSTGRQLDDNHCAIAIIPEPSCLKCFALLDELSVGHILDEAQGKPCKANQELANEVVFPHRIALLTSTRQSRFAFPRTTIVSQFL